MARLVRATYRGGVAGEVALSSRAMTHDRTEASLPVPYAASASTSRRRGTA